MSNPYVDPMHQIMQRLKPKRVLEIGLGYEGYSTQVWLHYGAHVTSIDKGDWTGKANLLQQMNPKQFKFILGRSDKVMPRLRSKYDFIYIDGDHRYEGAKTDMLNAIRLIKPGGVILCDDYGVTTVGGVDLSDDGKVLDGEYGVQAAADEVFRGWERYAKDIEFGNGGRAYRAPAE